MSVSASMAVTLAPAILDGFGPFVIYFDPTQFQVLTYGSQT